MRVKRNFNAKIDMMETGSDENFIIPSPYKGEWGLRVRALKFDLPSGEVETLITNLFDMRMGVKAFRELYFKRWPVETEYDIVKNKLEIEHFSGLTENAIKQEFYATMFMAKYLDMKYCRQSERHICFEVRPMVPESISIPQCRFLIAGLYSIFAFISLLIQLNIKIYLYTNILEYVI